MIKKTIHIYKDNIKHIIIMCKILCSFCKLFNCFKSNYRQENQLQVLNNDRYTNNMRISSNILIPYTSIQNESYIKTLFETNLRNHESTIIIYSNKLKYYDSNYFQCNKGDIIACGVLFYKIVGNNINYLTYNIRNTFADLGGKIESCDNTIHDTIAREVSLKTGNLLSRSFVKYKILSSILFYDPVAKYLLYFVELDFDINISNLTKLEWKNSEDLKYNIHPRLKFVNNLII